MIKERTGYLSASMELARPTRTLVRITLLGYNRSEMSRLASDVQSTLAELSTIVSAEICREETTKTYGEKGMARTPDTAPGWQQPGSSTGERRSSYSPGVLPPGQSAQGDAPSDRRNEDLGIGLRNRPSGAIRHTPYLQFHLLKALYFRLIKPGRRF